MTIQMWAVIYFYLDAFLGWETGCSQLTTFQVYKLNYTSALDYGRMPLLQCVGKKIDKVTLFNCYGKNLAEIGKQLEEFEFRRLEVSCEQLTKDTA